MLKLFSPSNCLLVAASHWHHHALVQTQTNGVSQAVGPAYPRPPHCPYSGTVVPVGTGAVTVVKDVAVDEGMVIVVVVKVRLVEGGPTAVVVRPSEGDGVIVVVVQVVLVESGTAAAATIASRLASKTKRTICRVLRAMMSVSECFDAEMDGNQSLSIKAASRIVPCKRQASK